MKDRRSSKGSKGGRPLVQRRATAPGKSSTVQKRYGHLVQAKRGPSEAQVHKAAVKGISGAGTSLPHADKIQASFGIHEVSGIQAHLGPAAKDACDAMGAEAYATSESVAFRGYTGLAHDCT
ncbi:MAG: DUF4157 domain-containing protein [Proteobacteria bacterium]|nr:DUF4157 domain-containing protein [Pseudomonadota bacterium]